ncbi:MAG TPA: leucyl aminopeptidase family protein [Rhodanobacteraceae bacterium]|nr:leucyl aminopeptidase family protein [Rhodanobacteraceae bacterium]
MDGWVEQRGKARRIPLQMVNAANEAAVRRKLGAREQRWLKAQQFTPEPGRIALIPDAQGQLQHVLVGADPHEQLWSLAGLPGTLPAGDYLLDELDEDRLRLAALGWALGVYRFDRYRAPAPRPAARLVLTRAQIQAWRPTVEAIALVRDLINTPTSDLGPAELAAAVVALGKREQARVRQWVGPQLLKANFPTIHAVGRAGGQAPRLVELTWGRRGDPAVTLVGKGVCFDSGGLNLKTGDGMRWMKKDMGGAAHAIALASLVMQARLPVRLTLLVPAVENAVAGDAYRPGDVIRTRAGVSVEVDNTDAEGRLVLCDALAYASESKPDLIIDLATLTGAARVALGPDLPALFSNSDALAAQALAAADAERDPLWRMPLWAPYRRMLESHIADTANCSPSRHAGAILAALYLQRFVSPAVNWLHLDVYGWSDGNRPGRPRGGDAQGLRALFAMLRQRYG